ncbi:MAG TPA: hypothetical protein GX707_21465, partial [Epulopiscium sp.]|nr:hypothetical protein [Candidatus Epulonipiscium sp.]
MKWRKTVSLLLVLTLIITVLPVQVFANSKVGVGAPKLQELETQETTPAAIQIIPNKHISDDYEVEFKVNSKWPGNFNGELIITNTGKKELENWAIQFDFDHEISNIWNAQIASHESQSYIIKNLGWNQDIAPGKSVSIGFTAKWDDNIVPPQNYETLGTKQEVGETDYTIKFKVTSDWGQAFNGEISITNNTEETIEDWMLEFDFDRTIERFWTAEIAEHTGEHYIIKNAGYNANIKPGGTIKLGFAGNPGNVENEPENYVIEQVSMEIDYEKDSDGDGLPDWFEKEIGTDPYSVDTDGDGLPDGYEYCVLGTDPLKKDTDDNGIEDGDEDFDEDGLTNIEEYELETDPHNEDTDFDGLTDYDEVYVYGTDPLKADTDNDGLEDGDEILFGFDPLNPDTNGNGILDGDEKTYQEYEEIITEQEKPEITKVSVAFKGNGNLQKTTSIENLYNIDMLSTDVVGLVGVPVDINTTSEFDTATITFHYDETLLGDIAEEDLCIMWYDEEKEWYEILDKESVVDEENNTVSVVTNHFSTYLVVNRQEWYKAWNTSLDYRTPTHPQIPASYYDIALVLDSSGSMGGTPIANAKHAARSFVNAMYPNDRIG